MHKFINLFKSLLKKYLPSSFYFFLYSLFKKIKYAFSGHTEADKKDLLLTQFKEPVFKTVTIDDISYEIKLDPNNGLVDKEIYAKGFWERDMLREIRKHVTKKSICLDIGANIGSHTLYMAKVASSGKVYAFDPIKKLADQIKESVNKNHFSNVEICNFGLSNKEETLDIYLNNLNMGNTTFKKRLGASSVQKATTKLFDTFWNKRGPIDFVKIDVEGYEYYCLLGMARSIDMYHPTVIIEFTPLFYNKMEIDSKLVLDFFLSRGYSIYDLEHEKEAVTKDAIPGFLQRVTVQTNLLCIYTK